MDKKTLLGIVLIGVILIGFSWYNEKQMSEQRLVQHRIDSVSNAKRAEELALLKKQEIARDSSTAPIPENTINSQKYITEQLNIAANGTQEYYTLENDKIIAKISNKGGAIKSVELKDFKTYDDKPLYLFKEEDSEFNLSFFTNQATNTSTFFFKNLGEATVIAQNPGDSLSMVLRLDIDSVSSIDYIYSIKQGSNLVDFKIKLNNTQNYISAAQNFLSLEWSNLSPQQERGFSYENTYTTVAYMFPGDGSLEELSMSDASKSEDVQTKLKWVNFKQQFFSSIFIAKDDFLNGDLSYETFKEGSGDIKRFSAKLSIPYTIATQEYDFSFFFGPNDYSELKKYDLGFEKIVPLGWGIFGWVNRFIVIPTFNFLSEYMSNYGLIILLLTILFKIILFPFTFKSYVSMAKMRLIKPEVDALGEKFPKKEDAMKKQQAMMDLYRRAGVNPMGGCLPMLLQLPIIIALFKFFPASIELRQEPFLWATDLSSYDSILQLPFTIPFYGDHVSLFALLMGASLIISTKINMQNNAASSQQLPGMNFMMTYVMPIFLIVWFNSMSSGLCYYYFISNIITIGQTYIIRLFVDDKKLHEQMKNTAKKPRKKTKWQTKYEEMVKIQTERQKQQPKK